ncbi:DUF1223 domain-containing protein [Calditrichota bacterium]
MKLAIPFLSVLLTIVSLNVVLLAQESISSDENIQVIVELFTSEGCSDCPSADLLLSDLYKSQPLDGYKIIPLEFHVDYWNRLGWNDPFSEEKFSDRQRAYVKVMNLSSTYTPQMIVQGEIEFVGSERKEALDAIRRSQNNLTLTFDNFIFSSIDSIRSIIVDIQVTPVKPFESSSYSLYTAITEDGLTTNVPLGENKGATLNHDGVVRVISPGMSIEVLTDNSVMYPVEISFEIVGKLDNLNFIAFIQTSNHGQIAGAVSRPLAEMIAGN